MRVPRFSVVSAGSAIFVRAGRGWRGVLACLICWLSAPAWALDPITLHAGIDGLPLDGVAEFQPDTTGLRAWQRLDPAGWRVVRLPDREQGITATAFWLRLRLKNPDAGARSWVLAHDYPWLDEMQVIVIDAAGERRHTVSDRLPFARRPLSSTRAAVRESIPAGAEQTVYVRLSNSPADILSLSVRLYDEERFLNSLQTYTAVHTALAIFYLSLFLIWLTFAIMLRHISIFSYLGVVLFNALSWAGMRGLNYQFLVPNHPYWHNQGLFVIFSCLAFFSFQFSRRALRLKVVSPRLDRIAAALMMYSAAVVLLGLAGVVDGTLFNILSKLALAGMGMNAWFAIASWRHGIAQSFWLMVGWLIYGVTVTVLVPISSLGNYFAIDVGADLYDITGAAAILETMCFTLAMVEWVQAQQRQRFIAERSANTDVLTGLNNRKWLDEHVPNALARAGGERWLAMIDLDYFKRVNDTYGHPAGDTVLRHFAELLRKHCRRDDLSGRLGGEEFMVLFENADRKTVLQIANRLREAFAARDTIHEEHRISHTLSIGLARQCDDGDTMASLTALADAALYRAKQGGRDRVCEAARWTPHCARDCKSTRWTPQCAPDCEATLGESPSPLPQTTS